MCLFALPDYAYPERFLNLIQKKLVAESGTETLIGPNDEMFPSLVQTLRRYEAT